MFLWRGLYVIFLLFFVKLGRKLRVVALKGVLVLIFFFISMFILSN